MKRTILIILCLVCFVTTFLVVRGEMAANQKIWDSKTGLDGILLEDGTVEITHYWNNDSLLLYIPSTLLPTTPSLLIYPFLKVLHRSEMRHSHIASK